MSKITEIIAGVKTYPDKKAFVKALCSELNFPDDENEEFPEPFQDATSDDFAGLAGELWDEAHAPAVEAPPIGCTTPKAAWVYELNLSGEIIKLSGLTREEFVALYSTTMKNRKNMGQVLPKELDGNSEGVYGYIGGKIWDQGHAPAGEAAKDTPTPTPTGAAMAQVKKDAGNGAE